MQNSPNKFSLLIAKLHWSVDVLVLGYVIVLGGLLVVSSDLVQGQGLHNLAVPAEFVRYVKIPGEGDQILRPSTLHHDPVFNEIFVGDPGNNRVVIFSGKGAYKFEFSLKGIMSSPRDIVTDPESRGQT